VAAAVGGRRRDNVAVAFAERHRHTGPGPFATIARDSTFAGGSYVRGSANKS
jgi:hypothetical protein